MRRDPDCTRCKLHKTAEYVCLLGSPAKRADVMIVGEAPGKREDDSGVPFVGKAGQLLREILDDTGFTDDEVFITNAVSCRPPDNRTPSKAEINACHYWLRKQIEYVKPKFLLLLGNVPLKSVLGLSGIKKHRGKPIELDDYIVLPTYHPAFALRDPRNRGPLEADIQLLRDLVDHGGMPKEEGLNLRVVENEQHIEEMLEDLRGCVSYDIETSCLYPWAEEIKSKYYDKPTITAVGFGTRHNQWVIPFDHWEFKPFSNRRLRLLVQEIDERLKDCVLVAHNGKFDSLWMKVMYGVHWRIDFDTMLAHYMLDENDRHGLKHLSQVFYGAVNYDLDPVDCDWEPQALYHAKDLHYTRKLRYTLGKKLARDPDVQQVFEQLMMPLSELFLNAEFNGVHIDVSQFDSAEEYLRGEIEAALVDLRGFVRDVYLDKGTPENEIPEINWRSPKQLVQLLFHDLGIPPLDKTKTGNLSTSESVLKRIEHPIGPAILRYRGAAQQLSFFIDGWKPYLDHRERLHPSFKLHGTVTGRPSCANPNLQQVPRDPRIRSLISAPPGWQLVEADLSQVELRIAAELSGDPTMLDIFYNGKDIHWMTAVKEIARGGGLAKLVVKTGSEFLGEEVTYDRAIQALYDMGHKKAIEISSAWKEHRKKAKAINFGYLYGMWWRKFMMYARDNYGVKVTEQQAQDSRSSFFETYSGLPDWHERQKRYARRYGYVTTLTGRKRRLPAAKGNPRDPETKEAQRQAINSPVQGFAAELNLMAALQLRDEYDYDSLRIVGTVHDAILFWIRHNQVPRIVPRILDVMSHPTLLDKLDIKLRVPIEAEAAIGPWSQGKELEEWLTCSK